MDRPAIAAPRTHRLHRELIGFGNEDVLDEDVVTARRRHAGHLPGIEHGHLFGAEQHHAHHRRAALDGFERVEHDPVGVHDDGAPFPAPAEAKAAVDGGIRCAWFEL